MRLSTGLPTGIHSRPQPPVETCRTSGRTVVDDHTEHDPEP